MVEKQSISGVFEGYYIATDPRYEAMADYYEKLWQKIIISDVSILPYYNSEELKTGAFDHRDVLKNVDVLISTGEVIKSQILTNVILKDFEIIQVIVENNKRLVKVKGKIYGTFLFHEKDPIHLGQEGCIDFGPNGCLFGSSENGQQGCFLLGSRQYSSRVSGEIEQHYWGCLPIGSTTSSQEKIIIESRENKQVEIENNFIKGNHTNIVGSGGNGCDPSAGNSGCMPFLLRFIGVIITIAAVISLFSGGLASLSSWLMLGFGLLMLSSGFFPRLRGGLGKLLGFLILGYLLLMLFSEVSNRSRSEWWDQEEKRQRTEEDMIWERDREREIETDTLVDDSGRSAFVEYFKHNHNWKENKGQKRQGLFKVRKDFYQVSQSNRESFATPYGGTYEVFSEVYDQLLQTDKGKLEEIIQMYEEIGREYDLDRVTFADMVVSSIQWIPYVLILETSCEDGKYAGGFISEYLAKGKPCLGNVKFGVQSPVEFMSNFKGDCDTRALLCFMVLDYFDYDVAVLISERYGHSVLGINLNVGGGDYVKYNGKRYYGWETTAVGFKAGHMPPANSNMRYWQVAIAN